MKKHTIHFLFLIFLFTPFSASELLADQLVDPEDEEWSLLSKTSEEEIEDYMSFVSKPIEYDEVERIAQRQAKVKIHLEKVKEMQHLASATVLDISTFPDALIDEVQENCFSNDEIDRLLEAIEKDTRITLERVAEVSPNFSETFENAYQEELHVAESDLNSHTSYTEAKIRERVAEVIEVGTTYFATDSSICSINTRKILEEISQPDLEELEEMPVVEDGYFMAESDNNILFSILDSDGNVVFDFPMSDLKKLEWSVPDEWVHFIIGDEITHDIDLNIVEGRIAYFLLIMASTKDDIRDLFQDIEYAKELWPQFHQMGKKDPVEKVT